MWLEEKEELKKLNIIGKALHIATMAHAGQTRKGTDIPYITHPVACAMHSRVSSNIKTKWQPMGLPF